MNNGNPNHNGKSTDFSARVHLPRSPNKSRAFSVILPLLIFCVTLLMTPKMREAHALGGFHGLSVSSWDTSVSTVALTGHAALFSSGRLVIAGYGSNFSAKQGNLSAQFKISYLNYQTDDMGSASHGLSGSAIALFAIPFGTNYDNGLRKMALNFYFGAAPSALISGLDNHLTIPLVLGIGFAFSPIRYLSIIPWLEASAGLTASTIFNGFDEDTGDDTDVDAVSEEIQDSMSFDYGFDFRLRGGLSLTAHLGNYVDLQIDAAVSTLGQEFAEPISFFVGGGLVFVWDSPQKHCENSSQ